MTIDELIAFCEKRFDELNGNAEDFKNLATWLKEYKQMCKAIEDIKAEIEKEKEKTNDYSYCAGLMSATEIIDRHISGEGTSKSLPEGGARNDK